MQCSSFFYYSLFFLSLISSYLFYSFIVCFPTISYILGTAISSACLHHWVHRVVTSAFWRTFSHEGKISLGWWEWGVHAHPLSLHLPSPVKLQCTLHLSGQIHWPCFISCKDMYSVVYTNAVKEMPAPPVKCEMALCSVIRFLSISAKFCICTVVGLNGTFVETKIRLWNTWRWIF